MINGNINLLIQELNKNVDSDRNPEILNFIDNYLTSLYSAVDKFNSHSKYELELTKITSFQVYDVAKNESKGIPTDPNSTFFYRVFVEFNDLTMQFLSACITVIYKEESDLLNKNSNYKSLMDMNPKTISGKLANNIATLYYNTFTTNKLTHLVNLKDHDKFVKYVFNNINSDITDFITDIYSNNLKPSYIW